MTWKEAFKIAVAVGAVLLIIYLIFAIVNWYIFRKIQKQFEKMGESEGYSRVMRVTDVSCITNSYYIVNLMNPSTKTVYLNDLNFYIDKSRVTCEGITSIEAGASATCKILQSATKGSHSLDISGPDFTSGRSVDCR